MLIETNKVAERKTGAVKKRGIYIYHLKKKKYIYIQKRKRGVLLFLLIYDLTILSVAQVYGAEGWMNNAEFEML